MCVCVFVHICLAVGFLCVCMHVYMTLCAFSSVCFCVGGWGMCVHSCVSLCVFCTDLTKLHVADSTDHWTCQRCAGDQFAAGVLRTQSTLGTVRVSWTIEGLNGLQPQLGFQTFTGTLTFLPVRTCKHQHTYICCQYHSPLCDSNCIE